MNQAIQLHHQPAQYNLMGNRILLFASYFLNIGAFFSHIPDWLKVFLGIMTALTTVMAFFNQFKTFRKNYKTLWIIHIFMSAKPNRKNRHKIKIIPTKTDNNEKPV